MQSWETRCLVSHAFELWRNEVELSASSCSTHVFDLHSAYETHSYGWVELSRVHFHSRDALYCTNQPQVTAPFFFGGRGAAAVNIYYTPRCTCVRVSRWGKRNRNAGLEDTHTWTRPDNAKFLSRVVAWIKSSVQSLHCPATLTTLGAISLWCRCQPGGCRLAHCGGFAFAFPWLVVRLNVYWQHSLLVCAMLGYSSSLFPLCHRFLTDSLGAFRVFWSWSSVKYMHFN